MKKRLYSALLIICTAVTVSSCGLLFDIFGSEQGNGKNEIEEPVYTPDYVWQLQLGGRQFSSQAYVAGKYLYLLEFIESEDALLETHQLVKIDMDTGSYVWKAEQFPWASFNRGFSNVIKLDDSIYFATCGKIGDERRSGTLYCYSDRDGSKKAEICLGASDDEAYKNGPFHQDLVTDGNNIYWIAEKGEPGNKHNLMKFTVSDIDYSKKDEVQRIIPEVIYPIKQWIITRPIIDNGVLYFVTFNADYPKSGYSVLAAVDLKTETVLWEKEIEKLHGLTKNSFVVVGDILYVINSSLLKVNKHTGEILLRYDDEPGPVYTKPLLDPEWSLCGIQYDEGRLYYTTIASRDSHLQTGIAKELLYSLLCVDANTFKFVWGFHPVGGTSSTYPIIANGRAYIVTHMDGLRVFDIKSGKLIGVDKNIISWGDQKTFLYKNYYIFFNTNFKTNRAKLCAIKV